MKAEFQGGSCVVTKEKGDPRFKDESHFLHHLKKLLNSPAGGAMDLIKKRMWKDGHLVDDLQQYLRSRKIRPGAVAIWSSFWSIEDASARFNRNGEVTLAFETIWKE